MLKFNRKMQLTMSVDTVCPTRYRTRHFFNNSNTNEDIANEFLTGVRSLCEK